MAPIPRLKWPRIWIGCSLYLIICALDELEFMLFALILFAVACGFYGERIKQRQQWRQDKLLWWVLNAELPRVPYTDWDEFERRADPRIRRVVVDPSE